MTKIQSLTLLIAISFALQMPAQGIKFTEAGFDSIKAIAKKENKLIFVDAYTSWCGPCKWMAKNIFTNDTVGNFYNSHFINYTLDMEKGEGLTFAKTYQVMSYPSLLYIDHAGKLVHKSIGSRNVKQFIALGEQALDPEKQLSAWQDKYESGKRDPGFIRPFLDVLADAGLDKKGKEVFEWYFYALPEDQWITAENFDVMNKFLVSGGSKEFQFLLKNREKYYALATKKKVDDKIFNILAASWRGAIEYKKVGDNYVPGINEEKFKAAIDGITNSGFERSEEVILEANMNRDEMKGDWKKYTDNAVQFVNKYKMGDVQYLNNVAWNFYEQEKITDKGAIDMAVGWAKKSVELEDAYFNNDTYAAILYKAGRMKEAKKEAEKAIALAAKSGEDASGTKKLLEKISKTKYK